jgi:Fis family transcriptional regulator, factor for inversion stimulation protein
MRRKTSRPRAAKRGTNLTLKGRIIVKNELAVLVSQMHGSGILYSEAVREFKKVFIAHVLQQNKGNQCKAARQLGMHRNTLSRTLAELDLDVRDIRRNKDGRRPPRSAQPLIMEKKAAR